MDENELAQVDAMQNVPAAASDEAPTPPTAGTFETYSPEKLALANNGTVVLFFHADWCPSCRGLENDINAQLSQIPENTHILKLDYDTETELKKRYGVIRQHTLVVVDATGTELKKLTGLTNTLDQVVNQL
jgi:thiol:disulfide interchange protein